MQLKETPLNINTQTLNIKQFSDEAPHNVQYKKCNKCLIDKELSLYRRYKKTGYLFSRCIPCEKERYLEWSKTESGIDRRKKAYDKYITSRVSVILRKASRDKVNKKYPERRSARNKVAKAIKRGDIARKNCEICGDSSNVDAHHDNYNKPLDVIFLCRKHHLERHKSLKAINHNFNY